MAEAFQQDLTCSICLDLFTEPVLLSCGHCFCQKCIFSFWDNQKAACSCPECRTPCPDRQHTQIRLLRNLAKKAWDMQQETDSALPNTSEISKKGEREVGTEGGQHELRCKIHNKSFELFCTSDEIPICYRCVNSSVHAGHSFSSLKDGAQSYKIKLAKALEPLELRMKELEELEGSQEEKIQSLKDLAASLRANTEAKFSELHQILHQRQAEMLAELDKDEAVANNDMTDRLEQIQEKLHVAKKMLSEGKSFMALNNPSSFLLSVRLFLDKLPEKTAAHFEGDQDDLSVLCRKLSVGKFKGPSQHLACRPLFPLFALELQPVQLDSNTAHPFLKIMNMGTRVITYFTQHHEYLQKPFCTVFAKHGFLSGKHYWEVEIEDEAKWLIGVAAESVRGKMAHDPIAGKFWLLQVSRATGNSARFGVYLDCEEGQVSCYRTSDGSHVYTYVVQFKEKVYPFFGVLVTECHKKGSLTICQK